MHTFAKQIKHIFCATSSFASHYPFFSKIPCVHYHITMGSGEAGNTRHHCAHQWLLMLMGALPVPSHPKEGKGGLTFNHVVTFWRLGHRFLEVIFERSTRNSRRTLHGSLLETFFLFS